MWQSGYLISRQAGYLLSGQAENLGGIGRVGERTVTIGILA